MKHLTTEIADDLEMVLEFINEKIKPGEQLTVLEAAARIEAFLATYREEEKEL